MKSCTDAFVVELSRLLTMSYQSSLCTSLKSFLKLMQVKGQVQLSFWNISGLKRRVVHQKATRKSEDSSRHKYLPRYQSAKKNRQFVYYQQIHAAVEHLTLKIIMTIQVLGGKLIMSKVKRKHLNQSSAWRSTKRHSKLITIFKVFQRPVETDCL